MDYSTAECYKVEINGVAWCPMKDFKWKGGGKEYKTETWDNDPPCTTTEVDLSNDMSGFSFSLANTFQIWELIDNALRANKTKEKNEVTAYFSAGGEETYKIFQNMKLTPEPERGTKSETIDASFEGTPFVL